MKLKYSNREARRTRGGSKIWYRNLEGEICWTQPFYWVESYGLSWSSKKQRWVSDDDENEMGDYSFYPELVTNYRQFRRLLKKWSKHLPDGVEFVLSGRLDELTITGKTKRKGKQ